MLCHKGDKLNQVCEIHTMFMSQVIEGRCIANQIKIKSNQLFKLDNATSGCPVSRARGSVIKCSFFGTLPLGGDF